MSSEIRKKELRLQVNNNWHDVTIEYKGNNEAIVTVGNDPVEIRWENKKPIDQKPTTTPTTTPKTPEVIPVQPAITQPVTQNDKTVTAPMPGRIIGISVKPNDSVSIGDEICILEAMKMQQTITATFSGTIKNVAVQPGDTIPAGQTIVEFE